VQRGTAKVVSIGACRQDVAGCRLAQVELLSGPGAPGTAEALLPYGATAPEVSPGDRIIVSFAEQAPEGEQYAFQDFDRGPPLLTLTILFAVGVLVLSRWRGIGALASLAYSLVLIALFTLPAIMEGSSPLAVAVVTAAAIMLVSLYLSHGFDVRTTVAMLGTLVSLALIGGVGWVFTGVGHFTGLVDEGSQYISGIAAQVWVTVTSSSTPRAPMTRPASSRPRTTSWATISWLTAMPNGRSRAEKTSISGSVAPT